MNLHPITVIEVTFTSLFISALFVIAFGDKPRDRFLLRLGV